METKGILRIEKRPLPCWLIIWIVSLPLLWGMIFQLFSLPSFVKYTADIAWIGLLLLMLFRRKIKVEKKVFPLALLVVVFFLYSIILYLLNYQSIIYFLWGMRNNFRFYVLFFAVVLYFRQRDAEKSFRVLDILFWVNVPITLIQYFVFHYEQDFLGGIFGVESGANASTIIFFTIVLSRSMLRYMDKKESFALCSSKCVTALFFSALAELKFFFVFFIIILIMSAFLTSFSWRKLLIFIVCAFLVFITSTLLVALFDFEGFLSIEKIWEAATQEHYSSAQTVNRLSAIPTLSETVIPEFGDRLFGFGLGNCDTSSFAVCNTPFYRTYGHLRYTFFSVAFLFLEVGYIGLALYVLFFVIAYFLIRNRIRQGLCNELHGRIALIMTTLSVILVVYNSSLRAEAGYMVFFVLALPFVNKQSVSEKGNEISAPEQREGEAV